VPSTCRLRCVYPSPETDIEAAPTVIFRPDFGAKLFIFKDSTCKSFQTQRPVGNFPPKPMIPIDGGWGTVSEVVTNSRLIAREILR
jgi:hypothetical protein